ncbi:Gfo/Idh/MocA family oxidoreductase [Streptomyces sp. NPDC050856]|uniref:Gfo/Idh/MocA family oxidoreductase n=1 Tax=Streptomyces sp. NPDC050856 TaxID=3154939 RepID=UPI0033E68CF7
MRVAVFGVGRLGAVHAQTLHAHPDVTEPLITDTDSARAAGTAARLGRGARATAGADDAFAAAPDAVVTASATAGHAALVSRAAEACLPTCCENPVAPGLAETVDALRRVRDSGTVLRVGFQRRLHPGYRAARAAAGAPARGAVA